MQIYVKQTVQACLIKVVFINLYGEKPYMSKRESPEGTILRMALNNTNERSYKMFAKVKQYNLISLITEGVMSIINVVEHTCLICDTQTLRPR